MKLSTKKTLWKVLISFLKWLLGIGREHIENAENNPNSTGGK